MANKYANLIGTNLIKDEYTKINTGFDGVDADIKAVESAIENHETAADPHDQYALDTDLATLESALEGHELDDTAHGIGAIAQAVDNLEQEVSSHEAEMATDNVHGLGFKGVILGLYSATNITAPASSGFMVNWELPMLDTSGFWSDTEPSKITIPSGVKKVRLNVNIRLSLAVETRLSICKNGTSHDSGVNTFANFNAEYINIASTIIMVSAGDYIEVAFFNDSESSVDIRGGLNRSGVTLEVVE